MQLSSTDALNALKHTIGNGLRFFLELLIGGLKLPWLNEYALLDMIDVVRTYLFDYNCVSFILTLFELLFVHFGNIPFIIVSLNLLFVARQKSGQYEVVIYLKFAGSP